jgi:hypothetical protein
MEPLYPDITPQIDPKTFILAGNAYFTLASKKTGKRFTYRVRRAFVCQDIWYVGVLSGPHNNRSYTSLGFINYAGAFEATNKTISKDAPSLSAFNWFWHNLSTQGKIPSTVDFFHAERCCRCGRLLTVPESVMQGIGPECATKARI